MSSHFQTPDGVLNNQTPHPYNTYEASNVDDNYAYGWGAQTLHSDSIHGAGIPTPHSSSIYDDDEAPTPFSSSIPSGRSTPPVDHSHGTSTTGAPTTTTTYVFGSGFTYADSHPATPWSQPSQTHSSTQHWSERSYIGRFADIVADPCFAEHWLRALRFRSSLAPAEGYFNACGPFWQANIAYLLEDRMFVDMWRGWEARGESSLGDGIGGGEARRGVTFGMVSAAGSSRTGDSSPFGPSLAGTDAGGIESDESSIGTSSWPPTGWVFGIEAGSRGAQSWFQTLRAAEGSRDVNTRILGDFGH